MKLEGEDMARVSTERWYYSLIGDFYSSDDGPYDSPMLAARAGFAEAEESGCPLEVVNVIRRVDVAPRAYLPSASWILESAGEAAGEDVGEAAEDWLTDVTSDAERELDDALGEIFERWLRKHGLAPTFWRGEDARVVTDREMQTWAAGMAKGGPKP